MTSCCNQHLTRGDGVLLSSVHSLHALTQSPPPTPCGIYQISGNARTVCGKTFSKLTHKLKTKQHHHPWSGVYYKTQSKNDSKTRAPPEQKKHACCEYHNLRSSGGLNSKQNSAIMTGFRSDICSIALKNYPKAGACIGTDFP